MDMIWKFLDMFTAYGQTQAVQPKPSLIEMMFLPMMLFVVIYFFMIRPQSKQRKAHMDLLQNLKKGDEVVTSGGIIGKIRSVNDVFVSLEIANGVVMKVEKAYISRATQPAQAQATQAAPAKAKT